MFNIRRYFKEKNTSNIHNVNFENSFSESVPSHIRELIRFEEEYEQMMGIRNVNDEVRNEQKENYNRFEKRDYGSTLLIKSKRVSEVYLAQQENKIEKKETRQILQKVSQEKTYPLPKKQVSYRELWGKTPEKPIRSISESKNIYLKKKKPSFKFGFNAFKKISYGLGSVAVFSLLIFGGYFFYKHSLSLKGKVMGSSEVAFSQINSAISNIENRNFSSSAVDFENAYRNFSNASENLEGISGFIIDITSHIPVLSKASSGKELIEAGKNLATAGKKMSETAEYLMNLRNPIETSNISQLSFLTVFQELEKNLTSTQEEMKTAIDHIEKVNVEDLPSDKREKFIKLKTELPGVVKAEEIILANSHIFKELLGGNGPRKYLFLFQNNQEMRATGGFIGSYGLLDIKNGRVKNFFIDGIFNPDGQFRDRVVPPLPIQKISVNWSLHDSNWFPDFPKSAEKAILFYEKTGGPTVDGVITLTPTIMVRLLEITGPIEMPEYGLVLTSDNFIAETQNEVEVDYDKQDNRPKKILSDFAPVVLDKIFNAEDWKKMLEAVNVITTGLGEKHILLYSNNNEVEKIISDQGWSGEILDTQRDFLSVINTNINGYKTDGVIKESIEQQSEIKSDGTIIDTVTITRKHEGGNQEHEWWNKVNADYMRVYVPLGSQLVGVEGQTREAVEPPVDYRALGFRTDPDIEKEENSVKKDEESDTRVYEDSGKTVFANWVYVSPQEEVKIKYTYQLPFKIKFDAENHPADSYSLLVQKQSGSLGSEFSSKLIFPASYEIIRKLPETAEVGINSITNEAKLTNDFLYGLVFKSKE
jgi:hypothetical protein